MSVTIQGLPVKINLEGNGSPSSTNTSGDSFQSMLKDKISDLVESGKVVETGYAEQPNNTSLAESMDRLLLEISELKLLVDKSLASLDRIFQESKS
jgi:hypothetical protein